jgi:hypothetical protein
LAKAWNGRAATVMVTSARHPRDVPDPVDG